MLRSVSSAIITVSGSC